MSERLHWWPKGAWGLSLSFSDYLPTTPRCPPVSGTYWLTYFTFLLTYFTVFITYLLACLLTYLLIYLLTCQGISRNQTFQAGVRRRKRWRTWQWRCPASPCTRTRWSTRRCSSLAVSAAAAAAEAAAAQPDTRWGHFTKAFQDWKMLNGRKALVFGHVSFGYILKGSLEVKFRTIWTDWNAEVDRWKRRGGKRKSFSVHFLSVKASCVKAFVGEDSSV